MVCDTFGSVCYPRNVSDPYRAPCREPCTTTRHQDITCTPTSCYGSCAPRCPRGTCRTSCRCTPTPTPPCNNPCSPCNDPCEPCGEPTAKFTQAMKQMTPCTNRFQNHLCPWEADVTVSGTIRAHCTSTADEISSRLAGPFKAFGKRFTTDSEYNMPSMDSCRNQKLFLGMLDDGGCLDFSKNNRPTRDGTSSNLDYRIRRIFNHSDTSDTDRDMDRDGDRKAARKPTSNRDTHISWDRRLDYNDSHDSQDGHRYSRRIKDDTSRAFDRTRPRNSSLDDDRYCKRSSDYRSFGNRVRGENYKYPSRYSTETSLDDGVRRSDRYNIPSGDRCAPDGNKCPGENGFEIMMNNKKSANSKRYPYTCKQDRYNNIPREGGYNAKRMNKGYQTEDDADGEEFHPPKYERNRRMESRLGDGSSNNRFGYSNRRWIEGRQFNASNSYDYDYDSDYPTRPKHNNSRSEESGDYRSARDLEELHRIRFWPSNDDAD